VALALCLVCAIAVSTAAVVLKPRQLANQELDRQRNIVAVAGLMEQGKTIEEMFENVEARIVDLETGAYVEDVDPATYDQRKAAKDPQLKVDIPREQDIANIGSRAKYATVYLVREGDDVARVVLPVHGYGLWSTMYGFLALENDGNTVYALKFYDQRETAGLGGEVDNPNWRALWPGKEVYDPDGDVAIEVIKGSAPPDAVHEVDGLAGATLTGRGVTNLMQYWLSDQGFGPYLDKHFRKST